jgi:hypothetical protein
MSTQIKFAIYLLVISGLTFTLITYQKSQKTLQTHALDSSFRLLTYGEPLDLEREVASSVVGSKWGISHYSVAGCVISDQLVDSVEKHNEIIGKRLSKAYGANWQAGFDKEVAEELRKEKIASSLLREDPRIIIKQRALEKEGNGLHFFYEPLGHNTYLTDVRGWGKFNNKTAMLSYYKYLVDIKRESVTLLSDSATVDHYSSGY